MFKNRHLLTLSFVGMAGLIVAAEPATRTITDEDPARTSSLTNKFVWTDSANWTSGVTSGEGTWTGAFQPDSATDYLVSGKTVRTPRFADYTFNGRSFIVGTLAPDYKSGSVGVGDPDRNSNILTFANEGLVLANGGFGQFYGRPTTLNGKIRILGTYQNNGAPRFWMSMNGLMPKGSDAAGVAGFTFTGPVTGDEGTALQLHIYQYSANYDNCTSTNSIYRFTGDLSACYSKIVVRPWNNKKQDEWPDNRRAVFSTSAASMPGTVELWRGGAIQLYRADQSFTLGSLTLSGDNLLDVPYDFDAACGATLDVTKALSVMGNPALVRVRFSGTDVSAGVRQAVLKAPAGVTLDASYFALERVSGTFRLEVANDTDGRSTLWLVRNPVIKLGKADGYNVRESFSKGTLPHGWSGISDDEWPNVGKDYVSEGLMLRSPATPNDIVFGGDALALLDGATLACRAPGSVTIGKFYMSAESKDVTFSHYASGLAATKSVWPYPQNGLCRILGQANVQTKGDCKIYFSLSTGRGLKYEMPLRGKANIVYYGYCEPTQNSAPVAHHWLAVPNPELTGRTWIRYGVNTWTKSDKSMSIAVPNMEHSARVYIEDPLCFGGPCPSFEYRALEMEDYSVLHPMKSMTFDDPTRGIQIANTLSGGAPVARFDVTNDVVFTIRQKINFAADEATLIKEGAGLLVFGEGCQPTFWDDQNANPSVSSNNIFRVLAGTFQPAAQGVCNGLQVSFAQDAKLVLDARTADANLLKYGLYNDIYRRGRTDRTGTSVYPGRPLSLEDGATEYAVEIVDAEYATSKQVVKKIGLVTVGSEYADEIEGKLKVASPYTGVALDIEKEIFNAPKNGGQLVTFSAVFRRGMVVIFR